MDIFYLLACLVLLVVALYLAGLMIVWICEIRRNSLYREMQKHVKLLENVRLSMAVVHARTYGIVENYRVQVSGIERIQQIIFENVLFIDRKNKEETSYKGIIFG